VLDRVTATVSSLATGTEPALVFAALGRHPRLFRTWLPFAATLLLRGELPRADSELVILRTAWNCRCWDEWHQHVVLARRAGLSSREVAAVAEGAAAEVWSARQRALLLAVDELHRDRRLGAGSAATLASVLSERQLVELRVLVGHYEMLAMVVDGYPEPGSKVTEMRAGRR
jgi:alkylhydroperoxidase family enzyme